MVISYWKRLDGLVTLAVLAFLTVAQSQSNGPIRLWRNSFTSATYTFGRVQVYFNSQWGNICDDASFGLTEATVICHQLGYTGASSYSRASIDTYGTDPSPTVLSSVDCSTSSYLVILQCSYDSTPPSSCTDSNDVSVNCYSTRTWSNPYLGQIRLTGGTSINQGLVEIYCSGQWGTVCDDLFGQTDANTVCRQLGYERAFDYDHLSIRGSSSQPIWLDDVSCSSSRSCIADCVPNCPVTDNCVHNEDITITCYSPNRYIGTTNSTCTMRITTPPPTTASISNGPIRLWRNGDSSLSYTSGRVQLVYNNQWGNICDNSDFGLSEAAVVCHQLGYTGASSYSRSSTDSFGTDTSPTVIDDVACGLSTYLSILQCSFSTVISLLCNNDFDVSVYCYTTRIWENPYNLQVRLTRGSTVNQGLVEVFCNGQWGTVCDDEFGQTEADTVCRQLGYYSAIRYDHLSISGSDFMPIVLDDVDCRFRTSCIGHCQQCQSSHNCGHSEDVTIECYSPFSYTGTNTHTCDGVFGPESGTSSSNIGAIIGGTIGGIILLVAFIAILGCIVKQHKHTSRVNLSTTRQTVVGLPPTTTTSVPTQPQQPPTAFNMVPRPEAAGATFTYNYNQPANTAATFTHNQPTDPSITAAPPPAYGIADNYATYNEGQSDLPPPSYSSETRPSLSLPPSAPPLYPAQSPAFAYPPSHPPQS